MRHQATRLICGALLSLVPAGRLNAGPPPGQVLLPLTSADKDRFDTTGMDLGDGINWEFSFSVGRQDYFALGGRRFYIRTSDGLKSCLLTPGEARTFREDSGAVDCDRVHVAWRPRPHATDRYAAPVIVTATRAGRRQVLRGLMAAAD